MSETLEVAAHQDLSHLQSMAQAAQAQAQAQAQCLM
jgi:hypothetical protein